MLKCTISLKTRLLRKIQCMTAQYSHSDNESFISKNSDHLLQGHIVSSPQIRK